MRSPPASPMRSGAGRGGDGTAPRWCGGVGGGLVGSAWVRLDGHRGGREEDGHWCRLPVPAVCCDQRASPWSGTPVPPKTGGVAEGHRRWRRQGAGRLAHRPAHRPADVVADRPGQRRYGPAPRRSPPAYAGSDVETVRPPGGAHEGVARHGQGAAVEDQGGPRVHHEAAALVDPHPLGAVEVEGRSRNSGELLLGVVEPLLHGAGGGGGVAGDRAVLGDRDDAHRSSLGPWTARSSSGQRERRPVRARRRRGAPV